MSNVKAASNITSPTQFLETRKERYAYRRFGNGPHIYLDPDYTGEDEERFRSGKNRQW